MPSTLDPELLRADIEAAREHFQLGRPATSLRRLRSIGARIERRADERAEIRHLRARLLVSQASALFEVTGDLEGALALLVEAEQLADAAGGRTFEASVRGQRGLLLLRSGRTGAALTALNHAAAVLDDAEPSDQTFILLNRGVLELEHGRLSAAEEDFARCLEVATAAGDETRQSIARHNLGYVDFLAGRLPRALAMIEEAAAPHPVALLDRARVLREAGLVRDADAILDQAAAAFRSARLQQDLAETELVRAECALVEGEGSRARALAASAHRRFTRRGNVRWLRRADLLLLRCDRIVAEGRQPRHRRTALAGVARRAADLAELCDREGRRDLARSARLLAQECRLLAAEPSDGPPAEPPPRLRGTDPLQVRLQARQVRALCALQAGDTTRAAAEVRRGLTELGDYQHSFGSLDLRTASAVHGSSLARLGLDVALRTGSPAAVLNLVEQSRAVSTRLPQVRPPSDARTAELLSELRQAEEEARALAGDAAADDRLDELRARAARLQRDIRARAWEIEGASGATADAPRCARVREAAKEAGAAFVSYARHQGRWVAVCVCGRRCEVHDLAPVADVSALVNRVRADLDALALPALPPAIREAVRRSLDRGLERLDELLLRPLRLGDRPVVLSCSGDLVSAPWGLLPSRSGVSTVVTPSAAFWLAGQAHARPAAPGVVTVAGPDLHRAGEEAELVDRVWGGAATALTGPAATTSAAHRALVTADLVHVAAHGRHSPDNPLFSSVRLTDGQLYAYEIDAGSGIAGCVVLSACESGLATLRPGDESLGLAHVLLQLGSSSVIAGVARVSDAVSAELMQQAHRAMTRGVDSATALAEAQRATLEGASPAAFVSFGAPW